MKTLTILLVVLVGVGCIDDEPAPSDTPAQLCGPAPQVVTLDGRYELLPDGRKAAVIDAEEFHRWRLANEAVAAWVACVGGIQ